MENGKMRGEFACFAVQRACRMRAQKARKTARPPPHWCRSHQRTDSWSHPGSRLPRPGAFLDASWSDSGQENRQKQAQYSIFKARRKKAGPNHRDMHQRVGVRSRKLGVRISPHPLPLSRRWRGVKSHSSKLMAPSSRSYCTNPPTDRPVRRRKTTLLNPYVSTTYITSQQTAPRAKNRGAVQ
jgi:hypothetical protein